MVNYGRVGKYNMRKSKRYPPQSTPFAAPVAPPPSLPRRRLSHIIPLAAHFKSPTVHPKRRSTYPLHTRCAGDHHSHEAGHPTPAALVACLPPPPRHQKQRTTIPFATSITSSIPPPRPHSQVLQLNLPRYLPRSICIPTTAHFRCSAINPQPIISQPQSTRFYAVCATIHPFLAMSAISLPSLLATTRSNPRSLPRTACLRPHSLPPW
jgi:hypothetical protein